MFTQSEFSARKREKLLDYSSYQYNFEDAALETFAIVEKSLAKAPEELSKIPPEALMTSTQERAWQALEHIANMYSAGHPIEELRAFFPRALEYWETYAIYSKAYNDSPNASHVTVGHLALADSTYVYALQLVSWAICLGWTNLLHRIPPLIDYRNPKDGLLERLLESAGIDRGTPPDKCTRHLPYFKTLKVFAAAPDERSTLMAEYLADWYDASRREPYYESHKRGDVFKGYWSWEAAAITVVLGIDDSQYRHAQFYPRDLADFALIAKQSYAPPGLPDLEADELRAKAGDPCPKAGLWEALDVPSKRQRYEADQAMEDLKSAYGLTVWRFCVS